MSIGMEYTSTMEGSAIKRVACEQCGQHYVYVVTRKASGAGSSVLFLDNSGAQQRAEERARKSLERQLDSAVEIAPCMSCGWLQQDMVGEARKRFQQWMMVTGSILTVIGVILLMLAIAMRAMRDSAIAWATAALVLGGGIAFLVTRGVMLSRYNANSPEEQEKWLAMAAEISMTRDEYEAMVAEQEARDQAADLDYDDLAYEASHAPPQQAHAPGPQADESDALHELRAAQQRRR